MLTYTQETIIIVPSPLSKIINQLTTKVLLTLLDHTATTQEETAQPSPATCMMAPPTPLHSMQKQAQHALRNLIRSIGLHTKIQTTNAPATQNSL
jgi:hypothetical protein